MSRNNLFGIACKTCRRRGRKCDRSLPTCMSCSRRGVECEGYVLRWVDAAVRGPLAGQTYGAPAHETDLNLALELRTPSQAKTTKADGVENSPHPEHVTGSECSSVHDTKSRAISILRQQSRSITMIVGIVSDDLGGLVKYCTEILRQSVTERY